MVRPKSPGELRRALSVLREFLQNMNSNMVARLSDRV
jgi:hypothetical protein